jgi:hypothetical protein
MFGTMNRHIIRTASVVLAVAAPLLGAQLADAATVTVTSFADSGTGSLRSAITDATAGETIVLPAGTYTVKSASINAPVPITITGAGANETFIDAAGEPAQDGILEAAGALTVTGVTFENASGFDGGAIYTASSLTLDDDAFVDNSASAGGAVFDTSDGAPVAAVSIDRTLFEGNSASEGGAVFLGENGNVPIDDSTFSGNSATESGGVVEVDYGSPNYPTDLTLTNDTLVGNSAPPSDGILVNNAETIKFENTVLADNGAAGNDNICQGDGNYAYVSLGHNLSDVSEAGCDLTGAGDRTGIAPDLSALGNHGGPTQTYLPLPGSPLIDGGSNVGCPGLDQRGMTRPFGAACDIGAVEVTPPSVTSGVATSLTATGATLNGTVNGNSLTAPTWYFQWGTSTAYGDQTPVQTASGPTSVGVSVAVVLPMDTTIHYRLVGVDGDGTTFGSDQTLTTLPGTTSTVPPGTSGTVAQGALVLSALSQSARRWRVRPAHGHVHGSYGTIFRLTLNEAATIELRFERLVAGHRQGSRCVAAKTAHLAGEKSHGVKACTTTVLFGSTRSTGVTGVNHVSFAGRIGRRALPPGAWSVVATAANTDGSSATESLRFTVVKG